MYIHTYLYASMCSRLLCISSIEYSSLPIFFFFSSSSYVMSSLNVENSINKIELILLGNKLASFILIARLSLYLFSLVTYKKNKNIIHIYISNPNDEYLSQ